MLCWILFILSIGILSQYWWKILPMRFFFEGL
jgi:hypothetical protein